jgi:hypothetical protein
VGDLANLRVVVGTGLVRLGLRILGHRPDESKSGGIDTPAFGGDLDDEPEDDGGLPPNVQTAVLSDVARAMIADGTPVWTPPREEELPPPVGSLADRLRTARREMGR